METESQGPGWWLASDGYWYSPEQVAGYRPPPPPESLSEDEAPAPPAGLLIGLASAAALGTFLPWVSAGPFNVAGTSGDGVIVLVLAIVAGALTAGIRAEKVPAGIYWVVLAASGLMLAVCVYDWNSISGSGNEFFRASVGSGLVLDTLASAAMVAVLAWSIVRWIANR